MKCKITLLLLFLPQLAPTLAATSTIPVDDDPSAGVVRWSLTEDIVDKLGNLPDFSALLLGLSDDRKAEALKAAAQEIEDILESNPNSFKSSPGLEGEINGIDIESDVSPSLFQDFEGMMPTCAERDCKKSYFTDEAMRWVKQALKDIGVVIHDNPAATTALLIGASVLVANIMSGSMLIPAALQAIGFGAKGPIRNTIAAAMQRNINPVQIGSMFSKLQSAAMGGAAMGELHKIANIAVAGSIGAGALKLVGAGIKPLGQSTDFDPREWRAWESESRFDIPPNIASKLSQFWGTPTLEGCVAYGYREVRAPLWFIPEGADPLNVCVRTLGSINGIGYKTPLGCIDEGPKKGVVGMWYVPTNETRCMPRWSAFEDEGCMLYGRRRKFARLMGLRSNDDWNGMCESMSATIDDQYYDEPSYCEDKLVAPALATSFTVAEDKDSPVEARDWNINDAIMGKLGGLMGLTTVLCTTKGVCMVKGPPKRFETVSGTGRKTDVEGDEDPDYEYIMPACAEQDCKKSWFMNEAMRWVKQALSDVGVFIYENRFGVIALLIGVSVLTASIMSGGALIQATLQAIGFGTKGPIKKSVAAIMQSKIDRVQMGSVFSKLQSAAMGGAAMEELHKIATVAVTGLIGAGAVQLVGAGTKPLGRSSDFDPKEWRTWEAESKFNTRPKGANSWAQFWGTPTSEGCIAYGYREIRAPLWLVREGEDPLTTCVRTRAVINGIGYKTPLGCIDEGPKKGVIGMWYVPTNEARCMPRWNEFEDEGCMLYGRRRKFARLMGLKRKDDWNGMCESTSASIDGKHYDGPSYCEDKACFGHLFSLNGVLGIYGIFDVSDESCKCSCVQV